MDLPHRNVPTPLFILVVDDDALIAMSTAEMLKDLGHEVIEAYSGKKALEMLISGARVDLVLTDQAMPRMTGTQLAAEIRRLRPDIPIILATGYGELPVDAPKLPRLGKPYTEDDLETAIAAVMGIE